MQKPPTQPCVDRNTDGFWASAQLLGVYWHGPGLVPHMCSSALWLCFCFRPHLRCLELFWAQCSRFSIQGVSQSFRHLPDPQLYLKKKSGPGR